MAELHRRASAWFETTSEPAEAVEHAVAGQRHRPGRRPDGARHPELARTRRESVLRDWVRLLPDDVVRTRPVLGVGFVGALAQVSDSTASPAGSTPSSRYAGPEPATAPWPAQPPPGCVVVDQEGYRGCPAQVEMYRAALALAAGDVGGTVAHAQEATALAGRTTTSPGPRRRPWPDLLSGPRGT